MPEIHPTAIVSPEAELAEGVIVGPYATIEAGVKIGPRTRVGTGSCIFSGTTIGEENEIHMYVVIGNAPQDRHYKGEKTYVEIGDRNRIREFVTIHRGTQPGTATRIGNANFFFATSHVAHNCVIADGITLVNGALLAGHVEVGSCAYIGGGAGVHQFVRVGRLATIAGNARVARDVPSFCLMEGESRLRGLNRIGLRRAGLSRETMSAIGRAYRGMFMSGARAEDAARALLAGNPTSEVREMADFVLSSCTDPDRRGICAHERRRGSP